LVTAIAYRLSAGSATACVAGDPSPIAVGLAPEAPIDRCLGDSWPPLAIAPTDGSRYSHGDRAREGSRNGHCPTTVKTTAGPITIERPKRRGTEEAFASRLFGKGLCAPTPRV